MVSTKRREMFSDLYRLAEYYEAPPFKPGDIDGNGDWFVAANEAQLMPFLRKWQSDSLATALAMDIVEDASRRAAELNKQ